jgi:N-dimethylarginine dimethylaminohydrolase
VIVHRPGLELENLEDPQTVNFLARPDAARAADQHDSLAEAYRNAGVDVHQIAPDGSAPPNLMFAADLFFMTPEGAILGRPASSVRAGEERLLAVRLASLGVPILASIRGRGTFEGADAAWINSGTVLVGTGLRTNDEGAAQVKRLLEDLGVRVLDTRLPSGTMHLMGALRLVDRDLALYWPGRLDPQTVDELGQLGIHMAPIPDEGEARDGHALNFVTLARRRILMAAGNPHTAAFCHERGIETTTVEVAELLKAAGGIGCLTGVLERDLPAE